MFTVSDISLDTNIEDLVTYNLLSTLAKKHNIIYVSGNHEEAKDIIYNGENYRYRDRKNENSYNTYRKKLESIGITFVENTSSTIYSDNSNEFINIYGVYFESMEKNEYYNSIKLDTSKFNIMLCHDPKYFEIFESMGFDLVLSGHVHGGVIRLPFIGVILSPDRKLFPKYDKVIYKINNSYMNVSVGLGDSITPRFLNPPEINLMTLKSNK